MFAFKAALDALLVSPSSSWMSRGESVPSSPPSTSPLTSATWPFAPRVARAAVIAIIVCICVVDMGWVLRSGVSVAAMVMAAPLQAMIATLLIRASRPAAPRRQARLLLAVSAVPVFAALPVYGQPWIGMPILFSGVALLLLPGPVRWLLMAFSAAVCVAVQWQTAPHDVAGIVDILLNLSIGPLEILGVARAAHLLTELYEARDELANAAVTVERARFAQDLDELLVRSLAMLQTHSSALIAGHCCDRAAALDESLATVRHALAQLRSAAREYRGRAIVRPVVHPRESTRFMSVVAYGLLASLVVASSIMMALREPQLGSWATATGVLALLVVGAGQALLIERFVRVRGWVAWAVLAGQMVVLLTPVLLFGVRAGLFSFVAATAVLVLGGALRWWIFGAVVVVDLLVRARTDWPQSEMIDGAANTILLTLVVVAATVMVRAAREFAQVQEGLAAAAVVAERTRFARDLHDLIGHSLSAIALKIELAQRLIRVDSARAEHEIIEIRDIARTAMTDARAVTNGPGRLNLDREARSAAELLRSASIEARADLRYGTLPAEVDHALAAVMREGVTNVLRHGGGARCTISVLRTPRTVDLVIENDATPKRSTDGSGLGNLAERVAAVGGQLAAGPASSVVFRLVASVPLCAPGGEPVLRARQMKSSRRDVIVAASTS